MRKTAFIGRLALIALACLGLVGRALVPAGFMPAPLGDGWPIKICPGVPGNAFLFGPTTEAADHHAGHHGDHLADDSTSHENHDPDRSADRNPCPVGAVFLFAALLSSDELAVILPRSFEVAPRATPSATAASQTSAQPRAPPSPLFSQA